MFRDQIECLQAIANELKEIIREPWSRAEVEARITGTSSVNIKAIYFLKAGESVPLVDFIMIPRYFFELSTLVSDERKGLYKICTFTLQNNGKYDIRLTY